MDDLISIEGAVLGAYVLCLLLLLVFSLAQLQLALGWRRRRRADDAARARIVAASVPSARAPGGAASLPFVTVQLPLYNEQHVVDRLLRAVADLDYPRDRLEVQVLDDSTDVTRELVDRLVPQLSAAGLTIHHVVRADRVGYKAGALAEGLRTARGELVAVLDADFVPRPDFLRVLVPWFAAPDVGAAQARWDHLNLTESALTRVQGFLLDLHFRLEQPARAASGYFLNFNGTAGIWRVAAIADAGGWSARTLTEDIDLSYRAQQRGWRIVYLEDHACPAELPGDMSGLRSQQYRWMKGGAQNARLHAARILRSSLPGRVRVHALQHLLAGSVYAVILTALLLTVPLTAVVNTSIDVEYADYGAAFVLSTAALAGAFREAQRPRGVAGHLRFLAQMARFMLFTMGLAVHNGLAVLAGWAGTGGEFVRTPKAGPAGWQASAYAGRQVDRRVLREIAVLAFLVVGVVIGWRRGEWVMLPLQLMGIAGLGWVLTMSLWHPIRARRTAAEVAGTPGPGRPVASVGVAS